MKINRQNISENNKTTVDWLKDFSKNLNKEAKDVDYLKEYLNKNKPKNKFNTIDEKLADIRQRVGLDLAIKISNEVEKNEQKTSNAGCDCQKNTTCSCEIKIASHSSRDIKLMDNILKYIKNITIHEPHLDHIAILNRCKSEEGLKFNELEKKIDVKKLIKYINDLLSKKEQKDFEFLNYEPTPAITTFDSDDRIADYYNHAEPKY